MKLPFFFIFFILILMGSSLVSSQTGEVRGVVIQEPITNIFIANQTVTGAPDTNATTACSGSQVLLGNGSCGDVSIGADINTWWDLDNLYIINVSNEISFNDTLLNATIDDRAGSNINVFDQDLNTTDRPNFTGILLQNGNLTFDSNGNSFYTIFRGQTASPNTQELRIGVNLGYLNLKMIREKRKLI